mgnify:CR=1 FL=1
MTFVADLLQRTRVERAALLSAPAIGAGNNGNPSVVTYVRFLRESYSFISYLEPVVWAAGARCGRRHGDWLQRHLYTYGQELADRTRGILDDITNLSNLTLPIAASPLRPTTFALNDWVLSLVARPQPSVMIALQFVNEGSFGTLTVIAAEHLRVALPSVRAFAYLESHRILDPLYRAQLDQALECVPFNERDLVVETARTGLTRYAHFLGGIHSATGCGASAVRQQAPTLPESLGATRDDQAH